MALNCVGCQKETPLYIGALSTTAEQQTHEPSTAGRRYGIKKDGPILKTMMCLLRFQKTLIAVSMHPMVDCSDHRHCESGCLILVWFDTKSVVSGTEVNTIPSAAQWAEAQADD